MELFTRVRKGRNQCMPTNTIISFLLILFLSPGLYSQSVVKIEMDVNKDMKSISPYIYGRNGNLSDNPSSPLTAAQWQKLKDLGITMFRENGGNNSTKYNWRKKLSSHPDWYNNVYAHDWDFAAKSLGNNIPEAQGMWGFQLIGKVAKSKNYNFNDWSYNGSKWWVGVCQNLAGGGTLNPASSCDALVEGNPELYLENWNADSTTGILSHWFAPGGAGIDSTKVRYWSMDNEPEIWEGTHDDAWPVQPSAEDFMQMYFAVAKKARELYPGIKLLGPVPANEWQWYNWKGTKISYKGNQYPWLEYFILRVAEEQKLTGIRLLDVLDIHFYPGEQNAADIVQLHRVFFDTTYNYPGANGVRRLGANSWDTRITKEYIFKRCEDWLNKYMGLGHGVKFSVSEIGINGDNPNVTALWYASTLGEFAKQGVEIFTPWTWKTGMNEVIHLFSRYAQKNYFPAVSSEETFVSAYPTINNNRDSLTLFLVNRHTTDAKQVQVNISDFPVYRQKGNVLQLSGLPQTESFVSHTVNALKKSELAIQGNSIEILLPALSVTAIVLRKEEFVKNQFGYKVAECEAESGSLQGVTIASSLPGFSGSGYITSFDNTGDKVTVRMTVKSPDYYKLVIRYRNSSIKYQNVSVNDLPVTALLFPATDSFSRREAGIYWLPQGENTFTISKNWGYSEIDKFELYTAEKNIFQISDTLVDPKAGGEARNLYHFLRNQFGKRVISGQTHDYYSNVQNLTGKSPMIRAGDFQSYTDGYSYLWVNGLHSFGRVDNGTVESLKNWYISTGKKGIVTFQWHWHSPSGGAAGTNTFYTDKTTFDITKAVTPGTQEHTLIIRDIDTIAYELKKFQKDNIPVLWRPLHEAGGGWFWWGAKGPEACKALYNILFDRLTNYHHLHNLLWVWSTPEPEWYPGNDKVDIIGYDSYPGEFNYGNQKAIFDDLYRLTQGKKLIAMTENGPVPDPEPCIQADAPWLYFVSWSNLVRSQNSDNHLKDVYKHPWVITLESSNEMKNLEWRSTLYPENWYPGYQDQEGRFLHDFSYAGYHAGWDEIPVYQHRQVDITQAPYFADNTGTTDVTAILQKALDDAGAAGGGVVFLPEGTYRIRPPEGKDYALSISFDSIVLRGAGAGKTFLLNDATDMRNKDIVRIKGNYAGWFEPDGGSVLISRDLKNPCRAIPVVSVDGFKKGDLIIIKSEPTDAFIGEHGMTGKWNASSIRGIAFLRGIDSVDVSNRLLIIDVPTRYPILMRDFSKVYKLKKHISETGIENLSIGNAEHPSDGWEEEDYSIPGKAAWDVHYSHAVRIQYAMNAWVRGVNTFRYKDNSRDVHLLSNGILLDQCRFVTIDSCFFSKPQYLGGGGNGYMYTLQANDCLIKNSTAQKGRHNFDFKFPYSNGNVIHNCIGEEGKYASDFHMYLSMSNLMDHIRLRGDMLESVFRPYGEEAMHGYSSTQSVFYNIVGEYYPENKNIILDSRQLGWGYIIGTSGPAWKVTVDPVEGMAGNYYFESYPKDFTEGIAQGENLRPVSLYLDQLNRRKQNGGKSSGYALELLARDSLTGQEISSAKIQIFNSVQITDAAGKAGFIGLPGIMEALLTHPWYEDYRISLQPIYQDTSFEVQLVPKTFQFTCTLIDSVSGKTLGNLWLKLDGDSLISDSNGKVKFMVRGGNHSLQVSSHYFLPENKLVEIENDTSIRIYMKRVLADVKFRIHTGSVPVENVKIKLVVDSLFTDANGSAVFYGIPIGEKLLIAERNGFLTIAEEIQIVGDTTVILEMILLNVLNDSDDFKGLKIWPNPAKDVLNGRYSQCIKGIRIVDLTGREIYREEIDDQHFNISTKDFLPGLFRIEISGEGWSIYHSFIKK